MKCRRPPIAVPPERGNLSLTISGEGRAVTLRETDMLRSEEMVRELAYALWERDGCPVGGSEHYWLLAEQELAVPAAPAKRKAAVKAAPAEKASVKRAPAKRAKVAA